MFRVINEYMSKVKMLSNDEIYSRLDNSLHDIENIKKYSISVNFNRYIINIKLEKYNIDMVNKCFKDFSYRVAFPYSELHIRFNEGKCIRYRYITSNEKKEAFYCDMMFN